MRQEIKLIILVFILVVLPAIAVSFFAGRVLGSWQIVLQKRMETDAIRVLDQAVAVWEQQQGQTRELMASLHARPFPSAPELPPGLSWVGGVFVVQWGAGLIYPPSESTTSPFIPPGNPRELSAGAFSTNPVARIQECRRLLQRPGLDPCLGAETLLRMASAYQMAGATNDAILCLKKVAGLGSFPKSGGAFLRDPDEGFYYDLIALKVLAEVLAAQHDQTGAGAITSELLGRVLSRYDGLVPLQRELLVAWIEARIQNPESRSQESEVRSRESEFMIHPSSFIIDFQWRERMRGRGLSADDRAKLAQDIGGLLPSVPDNAWIRARVAGQEMLVTKMKPAASRDGEPPKILAMSFNEPLLISHLNSLFAGITTNTGISIMCSREEAGLPAPLAGQVLLSSRRLPAPFGSVKVDAYPSDPHAFYDNARLQTRLYRWGGMLLLFSIVAGAWLIWRQAAGEIRQARERSAFAATVSHDLRTPLASMRMLAESLYMGSIGDEVKKQQFLGAIIKESDRLSRLTDRALYYIRYGQGALRYQFTEGDLGALVKDVVETFAVGVGFGVQRTEDRGQRTEDSGQRAEDGGEIRLDIEPGLPQVRFDGGAMEQVLFNLLDNAVKYAGKGKGARIEVALFSRGRTVTLSVADHGAGMDPDDVRRVLKPYARGKGATRHNAKGIGLGLALCQHVARAHGGKIQIESALGQGTTFKVILPVAG